MRPTACGGAGEGAVKLRLLYNSAVGDYSAYIRRPPNVFTLYF